ncbi:hypothetical protein [Mycobacteroides abscessus]|nr:hypothetical protein [Mycobacteroides abscessus]MDO3069701.1 hypothetical protein [Mycobacteroides abscessus subsp. bolletii]
MSGSVVVVGIDPYLIDFSNPEFASTGRPPTAFSRAWNSPGTS